MEFARKVRPILCLKTSLLLANMTVVSLHHASNAYREIPCKAEFILNLSTLGWVAIFMLRQPCLRWKKPVPFGSEKVVSITSFHEVDNTYFDIPLLNMQEKNL